MREREREREREEEGERMCKCPWGITPPFCKDFVLLRSQDIKERGVCVYVWMLDFATRVGESSCVDICDFRF